ncbi:PQQ-like beta-propeller repeat protein [soil metagenome]
MFRIMIALLMCVMTVSATDPVAHRFVASDREKGHLAIINAKGEVEWEFPVKHDLHDLQVLENGNILTHTSHTTTVEINPKKEIVWKYESQPKVAGGKVEVHAVQRLADGNTMISESGNSRIIEVNAKGEIVKELPLKVTKSNSHRDTRMVRKLANNNYLVCQEGEGVVREYDPSGKIVWEYKLELNGRPRSNGHGPEGHGNEVFGAVRLSSGNTLIGGGNNNRVFEVDPAGKIVWQIDQKELPGITLAWVTTVQVLPNGNIVFGNCHAGAENPQLIEVTRDKKVVWTYKNHKLFGNSFVTSQILDEKVIR